MFPVTVKCRPARTVVEYEVVWSGSVAAAAARREQGPAPPMAGRRPRGGVSDVVAAAIQEGGAWSIGALAERTGFTKTQVNSAVWALEKERGVLTRHGAPHGGIILWSWKGSS